MALYRETIFDQEVRDQLYQLNEQLKYMFGNLTPEDNYSKDALQKYFENDEKIASLIFDVNGLDISLKNFKKDTEAKFQLCNNLFCIIDAESEEEIELREMLMEQIKDEPATVEYVHNFLTNREEK